MKNIIFAMLISPFILFGQSSQVSNIPLPKTYIQNLDPYPCSQECMQDFIDKDMILSFLSYATSKLENEVLNEIRMLNISILNIGSNSLTGHLNIALLLPYKRIGKYAASTTNASFAYLMTKNHSFDLKSYKIESENQEEIEKALQQIKKDGFSYVIAPLTLKGARIITKINPEIHIYFPTIHKKDIPSSSSYLYYGAIDYKAQTDLLLENAKSPLVIFHDKSATGKKLANYEEESFKYTLVPSNSSSAVDSFGAYIEKPHKVLNPNARVFKYSIPKRTSNLQGQLKKNTKIRGGTFFINTPIIKTSMILSQLTLYDTYPRKILSTQINYSPLLLSMTQYEDRKKMLIANSITENTNLLIEINSLLGNDIVYDWINYTTTVGVDFFYNEITGEAREYKIAMKDSQMIYPIEIIKPSISKFNVIDSSSEK
jgi:hypothetical protein